MRLWRRLKAALGMADRRGADVAAPPGRRLSLSGQGLLTFEHTGEVIRAETALRAAGFDVAVKGPPPDLRAGCDMVIVFELMREAAVRRALTAAGLEPLRVVACADGLLEPVSFCHATDFGPWLMVRAANMKITVRKDDRLIVNISGGGCPDVPYVAALLVGRFLDAAPEPRELGQTLCCYSLQKAFEEIRRRLPCGSS